MASAAIVSLRSLWICVGTVPCGQNNVSCFSKLGPVDLAANNFLTLKPSGPGPLRQAPGGPGIEGRMPACLESCPSKPEL